ncbi:uncharacterized protein LOC62_02G002130 [Vanrija pseudolonga]|uniref:Uncharacterized protein n=1 Tax=Vanrija pseudolonga TaxID=143232 RepID=A0AAF1BJN6_9TREE|nr:hypothetical protein LOC62_02G002130 [Vanrija pseudolonga]
MSPPDPLKYYWTPKHKFDIEEFIKKYKPSILSQDDAPWIWARNGGGEATDPEAEDKAHTIAIGKGQVIVDGLVKKINKIDSDSSIPVRASKGVKSKKVVRDENVDGVWARVARSVASGPLKDAGVNTVKVATVNPDGYSQLICLYVDNVYDKGLMTEVMKTLLTEHGIEPSSSKSDLYTVLGIDSKHPSKLRSTVWQPKELMDVDEIKALKAEYNPSKDKPKKAVPAPVAAAEKEDPPAEKSGVHFDEKTEEKSDSRKRNGANDEPAEKAKAPPAKRAKTAAEIFKDNDIFAGSDSDDED